MLEKERAKPRLEIEAWSSANADAILSILK